MNKKVFIHLHKKTYKIKNNNIQNFKKHVKITKYMENIHTHTHEISIKFPNSIKTHKKTLKKNQHSPT